ncbi:nitrite reductase small subunit NirD [Cellulomonas endophytica]|uniref:nitrite reductase small subunit NirD n=1 Tax=Cellulomonas endophytica TaxID=2494735 RepID=UPI001012697E|nr:nitrite reductase small subunit NirD [Cellulomonas endophytica]
MTTTAPAPLAPTPLGHAAPRPVPDGALRAAAPADRWHPVCALDDLVAERGAAALVDGVQVALFRLHDGTVRAVDHRDPASGANVMARGLVGTRGAVPTVAGPLYKQVFDLTTGRCLDDPALALGVHEVQVAGGTVLVRVHGGPPAGADGR